MFLRLIQGGAPSSYKLVINPLTIDISPTKTIVIGVMFTNLAILGAPPCSDVGDLNFHVH